MKESEKRKVENPNPRELIKSNLNECLTEVRALCEKKQIIKNKIDEVKYNSVI